MYQYSAVFIRVSDFVKANDTEDASSIFWWTKPRNPRIRFEIWQMLVSTGAAVAFKFSNIRHFRVLHRETIRFKRLIIYSNPLTMGSNRLMI